MAKYIVSVDKDLEDVVPAYLETRRKELPELFALHSAGDLESLRKNGHKLSGSGGGYGFDRISELGRQIETLALAGDSAGVAARLAELKDYVENVDVVYQ
ncbi:MAG TPA: Hpt domain-containing protein [Elusimicrobia bacterium]|nr:Hpt domain-containing protein [Elusimicrobiota bacterium]